MVLNPVVVIMAGGAGTRFWPASTNARPKQLLALTGVRTLLQQSLDRALALTEPARVLVVTGAALSDAVRTQVPELPAKNVLAEPMRKDTAAAVAWAALEVQKRFGEDAVIVMLTSDHVITPTDAFTRDITRAVGIAREAGALVTLGIPPTYPATGFGYLELDGERVAKFVEKPNSARAVELVARGCLWNSGMFVWTARSILSQLTAHLPAHVSTLAPAVASGDPRKIADAFAQLQKISIDFGVMEKAADVRCVRASFTWSDVGSFPALHEHLAHDTHENAAQARIVTLDAKGNVVWSDDASELVALVGVSDLVVVRAGKRTLVTTRARAEDVKKLVESLPPEET